MESGDAYIPISVRLLNNSIFIRTPNSAEYCLVQGKNSLSIVIDQLWSYLCEICLASSSSGRKTGEAKVNL